VSFIGLARPDDRLLSPSGFDDGGTPIYERPFGYGFNLVVEGKPGPSRRPVARSSFNYVPGDPGVVPDLQVIVSEPLGENPSRAVCDIMPGFIGGVPASSDFDESQAVADAMNDLGCRFIDGDNQTVGRNEAEACLIFGDGEYRFAEDDSTVQFCAQISVPLAFRVGDTMVTARLRDTSGATGPPARIIVRVRP
jgi:hypothetical protein